MQHDHIQTFLPFNSAHWLRVCVRNEYVLAWRSMLHFLKLDMQVEFRPFDPAPRDRWVDEVCGLYIFATMLLHL